MNPFKPHDWIAGIKRIPVHLLFSGVGIGAKFLPPPWNIVALGGFAAWRLYGEHQDHAKGLDTPGKAVIDWLSQVGSAVGGSFLPIHF
jgi:hypothetical protein